MERVLSFPRLVITVICVTIYLLVATSSFNSAVESQEHYCDMVGSGAWPDYRGIFNDICVNR